MIATITADGFDRVPDDEVADRFRALLDRLATPASTTPTARSRARGEVRPMSMPFYVAARAGDEGQGRLRPQGHRPGPAAWPRSLYATASSSAPRTRRRTLRKVSEIYDRIAFAGAGKYNEFDQLRIAGVRHADLKGYSFSREDVDAQSLANEYAQMLGEVFTHEMKPMEVEILVAEVGARSRAATGCSTSSTTARWSTRTSFTVLGGEADAIAERLEATYQADQSLAEALRAAVAALAGPERS